MKRTIMWAAAMAAALWAFAGQSVPYASDFYVGTTLDAGWTVQHVQSRGMKWTYGFASDYNELEVTGCAKKAYDSSLTNASDSWLISPAINVTAGKEYTVSIMAYTSWTPRFDEHEAFRVKYAYSDAVADLKAGPTLIEQANYQSAEWQKFEATFTAETTGEVHFGVQCFSDADMDTLYVAQFSVTGDGEEGEDPIDETDGKVLPYTFDFTDSAKFNSDWTSVAGAEAEVKTAWNLNTFIECAEWAFGNRCVEDNWLISPALAVTEAGAYVVDALAQAYGDLEVLIGTDPEDLSSFRALYKFSNTGYVSSSDDPTRIPVSIETPGKYYVAFRACSEVGTNSGHRVYSVTFKEIVVTPGVATDFVAVADPTDALSVMLSWDYPSVTNTGEALDAIAKAELYRGEDLIETFNNPNPGGIGAYMDDAIEKAGVYTYKLIVYGDKGYDTDHDPATATTGYVGKPMVETPCSLTLNADNAALFTIEDANLDDNTWFVSDEYGTIYYRINNSKNVTMDDYLATPYLHLNKGYYRLTFNLGGMNTKYQLGYASNRHSLAETFVAMEDVIDDDNYSPTLQTSIVSIPAEGDYCFVVRMYGTLGGGSSYYNYIRLKGFEVEEQILLPGVATALKGSGAEDESLEATLTWVNPSLDNAGQPLESLSKAVIYRDGEKIAEVTDIEPGQESTYVDSDLEKSAEYTYSVEIYNANGKSEADAPEVIVFVGGGIAEDYTSTDFADWKTEKDGWNDWEPGYDGVFGYSNWQSANAYALSPYINLKETHSYQVDIETVGGGSMSANLMIGQSRSADAMSHVGSFTPHEEDDMVHTFTFLATKPASAPARAAAEDATDSDATMIPVQPGKNVFAFHANGTGNIKVKSFSVADKGVPTGVETVYAAAGDLRYGAGKVTVAQAADIAVYALDGSKLMSAEGVTELDLTGLAKGQTVIVTSGKQSLKLIL